MNTQPVHKQSGPTLQQKQALDRFAAKHGRNWRAKLRTLWTTGADERHEDGGFLRQVRNQMPASFLRTYQPGA